MNPLLEYTDEDGATIRVARFNAPSNYSELVEKTLYDGVPIGKVAHNFKNDGSVDPRFAQSYADLNAVAYLLVTAGYYGANLHYQDRPDVRADFSDGSVAFIEASEVIESPSARLSGALDYVNVGIAKAIRDDPTIKPKLDGHFIGVRAWMTRDGRYNTNGILADFLHWLRESDFDSLENAKMIAFGSQYPELAAIDAKYYHAPTIAKVTPRFDPAAHSFAPESLSSQTIVALEKKRQIAANYAERPLWLGLYISDPLGVPELSLDSLEGVALDFSPYEKLIVGDQRAVMVYTSV